MTGKRRGWVVVFASSANLEMRNDDFANDARVASGWTALRSVVLVALFSTGAILESGQLSSMADPGIWGHLRVGSWMLENRIWPATGVFSQAGNVRWMDFTWGYDLVAAVVYRAAGLRAIPALLMVSRLALAVISFLLGGAWEGNFRVAVCVSAATQYALWNMGPGAGLVSPILFGVELLVLMESRRSGNAKMLLALPILFFVWVNLDIEFVYGITVLGLFLLVLGLEQVGGKAGWSRLDAGVVTIRTGAALRAGGLSFLATLVTPYPVHAYREFFAEQTSQLNRHLPGYTAMSFHRPQDYVLMLVLMAAVFSMGRRRSRDLFLLGLLAGCAAVSFHAQRVSWLAAIAAVSAIGESGPEPHEKASPRTSGTAWRTWMVIPAAALALVLAVLMLQARVPAGREALLAKAAAHFPVHACDYVREHRLPGPLFNAYLWGGFLTWYLPEYPVAIDFRRGLYPEEEEIAYFKVMNAELPYESLPSLEGAGTLLLEKGTVMAEALASMPGFQMAYQDDLAVVLLRESVETGVR